MMEIVPLKREHLKQILIQNHQIGFDELLTPMTKRVLERDGFTAIEDDEVIACAGVSKVAPNRAIAWAYVSRDAGPRMLKVTRAMMRYLEITPYRRIEADVDCDFEEAHRWVRMMGFELECERRRAFTPEGRDCALYARVL
jgi:RimJ/RimL family protein N-acetyltransferase